MNFRFGLQALLLGKIIVPMVVVFAIGTAQPVMAACAPDNPVVGGTVICTGIDTDGFDSTSDDLTVIVEEGASIINDGHGISIYETGLNITNAGTIKISGPNHDGIYVDSNNTIVNVGVIENTASNGDGISAQDDNIITNTGVITVKGPAGTGIDVRDGNTINNSGKIVSEQHNSIEFRFGPSTLNLMAPSFLGGTIDLGTGATVNIATGASQSVLWDFSTGVITGGVPNISGPVPGFYNAATNQFATFDPTGFAANADRLAQTSGMISDLTTGHLLDANSAANIWVTTFGQHANVNGSAGTLNRDITSGGLAAGGTVAIADNFLLGLLGGYVGSHTRASTRFTEALENKAHGFFTNAHGRVNMEAFFIGFGLSGGANVQENRRFVNDNLAPLGVSWSSATYGSWWLSPELSIGTSFAATDGWVVTPSAQLRYAFENVQGFSETGSNANALVSSHTLGVGEARLEIAATRNFSFGALTGRLGAKARKAFGGKSADVTLLGQTQSVTYLADGQLAGYVGVDAEFQLNETAVLDISGQALLGTGSKSISASATLSNSF